MLGFQFLEGVTALRLDAATGTRLRRLFKFECLLSLSLSLYTVTLHHLDPLLLLSELLLVNCLLLPFLLTLLRLRLYFEQVLEDGIQLSLLLFDQALRLIFSHCGSLIKVLGRWRVDALLTRWGKELIDMEDFRNPGSVILFST